ncbi:MAG: hypothetical protein JWM54_1005, partial [Acidobacteriaceae bacterium]|nr:hypothetical protein [Acidobacteriaceae bacterium]
MEHRQRAGAGCGLFPMELIRSGRLEERRPRLSQQNMRAVLLLLFALLGTAVPAWARFNPRPCKNAYTEQQEITE